MYRQCVYTWLISNRAHFFLAPFLVAFLPKDLPNLEMTSGKTTPG